MELYLISLLATPQLAAGYNVNNCGVVLDPHIFYQFFHNKTTTIPVVMIYGAEILPGKWSANCHVTFSTFGTASGVSINMNKVFFHDTPEKAMIEQMYYVKEYLWKQTDALTKDIKIIKDVTKEMDDLIKIYSQGESRLPLDTKREVFRFDSFKR